MAAKCPHCGAQATLEGIRAANGRCPSCNSMVKVKFTGAPRPVAKAPAKPPGEGLRNSLENIGPYEILAEISRGGMGIVYKARDKNLKKTVAIKVLLRGSESSAEELKRFRREAEAAAKLQHSNIVPIHAVGVCQGLHYFIMDFIEGSALSDLAARGGVSPRQALDYVEQLADALTYAHAAGVFHRDIKPANVMIDRFDRPQLMDFGLAKDVGSETQLTQVGTTMGTPTYMPPEQAEGDLAGIDAQSDVYSLGAVLYELLTGQAPFEGPTTMAILMKVLEEEPRRPRNINPRIHPDVEAICLKAMAKDKRERYKSAAEFRDDIRRFKAGEMIEAARGSAMRRAARMIRRHGQLFAALLLLVLAAGALVVWRTWAEREDAVRRRAEADQRVQQLLTEADELAAGNAQAQARAEELYKLVQGLRPGDPAAARGLSALAESRRRQQIAFFLSKGQSYLESGSHAAAGDMFEEVLKLLKDSDPEAARARAGLRRAHGTGTLTLSSRPAGAAVYVAEGRDFPEPEPGSTATPGRRLGVTPLVRADIPMGLHRITLVRDGFGWQSLPVDVERGQDFRLEGDVELFPVSATQGSIRAASNLVRVPAGTLRGIDGGRDVEVGEFLLDRYEHPNRLGIPPVRGVSRTEAQDQASRAGKRLPVRSEWLLAAGGPKGLGFPYGDVFKPDYAVTGRAFDEGPLPSGSRPRDRSPCGAYDMSGNVSEWVAPEDRATRPGAEEEFNSAACGGNWTSIQPESASVQWTVGYGATDQPEVVGFRCALSPPDAKGTPGTAPPIGPRPQPDPGRPPAAKEVVLTACPQGMIEIRPQPGTPAWELVKYPFCIDRFEFPNEAGKKPRNKVTWHEADRLARAAGLRLATFEEWQVAAGGARLTRYPHGSDYDPGRLPVGLGREEGPVESGSWPGAESPFKGLFDLNGNLAEWVEPRTIEGRRCWGVAGGHWFSNPENATAASWEERAPDAATETIGFRRAARLEK
ncbi:MAG TPA: protein kinase [Planctomycetota bacterium]|nr:protein kinase [Planctomycetota bacterium]